jgi:tRNA pseudouridine38-40 synthase
MRLAIKFAYDEEKFHGYARQPNFKTVEGDLIEYLMKCGIIQDTKESSFRSASRTDKGVSALGNVVAFNTDISKKNILQNFSDDLSSIILYGKKDVEQDFNPRHAKFRQYRYYLPVTNLDIERIIFALNCFTGEHNFSNFAKLEPHRKPIRTIDNILFMQENDILILDFFAQTFLWHQIRRIISALIKVGSGKLEIEKIRKALNNPEKKVDFGLAPAKPLILKDVVYNFEFEYDTSQLKKVKLLEKKIISYL